MRSAASLVKQARLLAGYSRAELARAADVAGSTIGRIENGEVDPTWSVLGRVLAAAGFRLGETLISLGDERAIEAAINALSKEPEQRDDEWTSSWSRAGLLNASGRAKDPARVAALAGLASEIPTRRGARRYLLDGPIDDLVVYLVSEGANPVLTGPAGFDDVDPAGVVVYVDDPGALPLAEPQPYRPTITALPRPKEFASSRTSSGVEIAAPARALIDSYASGGRVADRADAYATRLAAS